LPRSGSDDRWAPRSLRNPPNSRRISLRYAVAATVSALLLLGVAPPTSSQVAHGHHAKAASARPVVSEPVVIPASLNDVDFSSPKTGWVTTDKGDSGQILGTTDSGRSWRSDWAGSGVVGQVDSGGSGHVWALVQAGSNCDGAPADSTCVSNLLASSNAGRSWTYRGTFPADNAVQIAFSKTSLGLAAGISRCVDQESDTGKTSYPPSACRGSVLLSTDGGRRWKTSLKTPGPVFAVAQSPRTLWAVEAPLGGFVGADGSGRISIIRSQNRGQSWSTVGSLPAMLVTPALNAKLIVGTRSRP